MCGALHPDSFGLQFYLQVYPVVSGRFTATSSLIVLSSKLAMSQPCGTADTWALSLPHWVGCSGLGCTGCRNCPHAAFCGKITDIVMNSRLLTRQCGCRVDHLDNTRPQLPIKCMPSNTQLSAVAAKPSQPRRGNYRGEWVRSLCPCGGSLFSFGLGSRFA